uniref:Heat stress transcription factor n=1 Tax=Davidia involucrata TaxID=16924 RepID=A0A5B7A789_DAVIN
MVKTTEHGFSVPPFLLKCFEMVDDQSTDALISWSSTNDSFVIWDASKFSSELLPKYFKHSNFSSFIRQLNIYGFRKVDTDRWVFSNDGFIKGQKHLLKNISRRKQTQGLVQRKSSQQKEKDVGACEENKNIGLWKEVESLKTDKNVLMQELIKLRQHQQTSQSKLLLLREQLQGMEKNQQQMLSFIVMAMQNPGFLVQLLQPKENNWRMAEAGKNSLKRVTDDSEPIPSEGMIVRYQAPMDKSPEPLCTPTANSEKSLEFDLSSDEMKDLFMNIDFMSVPLDEKFLYPENHSPIILPDLPDDDGMLELLLLSGPFLENNEDSELDTGAHTNSGMEVETTLTETQPKESDKFEILTEGFGETSMFKTQVDNSQNMEILTEQI